MGDTRTPTGPVLSGKTGMVVSLQVLEYEKVFTVGVGGGGGGGGGGG